MSARDDYPIMSLMAAGSGQVTAALDEIDRLRRWKAEAVEVLLHWDAVTKRFDVSAHLGRFTADAVGAEIDALRQRLAEATPDAAR